MVQSVNRVMTAVVRIVEETIVSFLLAADFVFVHAVGHDHVIDALKRIASYQRIFSDDVEIFFERSNPSVSPIATLILFTSNQRDDFTTGDHGDPPC